MNPSRLRKEFLPRFVKIASEAEDKLEAIRDEICKEYGWKDNQWVQITLEIFPDKKYRVDLVNIDEEGNFVGDVTSQPIGKKAAELLIEMGFPSGS